MKQYFFFSPPRSNYAEGPNFVFLYNQHLPLKSWAHFSSFSPPPPLLHMNQTPPPLRAPTQRRMVSTLPGRLSCRKSWQVLSLQSLRKERLHRHMAPQFQSSPPTLPGRQFHASVATPSCILVYVATQREQTKLQCQQRGAGEEIERHTFTAKQLENWLCPQGLRLPDELPISAPFPISISLLLGREQHRKTARAIELAHPSSFSKKPKKKKLPLVCRACPSTQTRQVNTKIRDNHPFTLRQKPLSLANQTARTRP